ncbi:MAG TPA: 2-dehydropantoate 2-reductase [Thermoplasmata archaeon]|nr:2-dehydropantoate 2-reductase [Thermoplasmata archaeon]
MRVLVFGAGAIGSVLGAMLARSGTEVLLVGRPAHVAAIEREGLLAEGVSATRVKVAASTEIPLGATFDRILLTVKTFDLEEAAGRLTSRLRHPAPLLALENGLGLRARLSPLLRSGGWFYVDRWLVRGILTLPATLVGPGEVRLAGDGELLLGPEGAFGGINGFDVLLSRAGLKVRRVESVAREEWRKALVNAAINPVTADHGVENGRLADDPWRGQALSLLEEARSVAASEGFEFTPRETEEELFRVVRWTAKNRSSMLQDLDHGRPTEIEAISGAILRLGRDHGLRLPQTERIVGRIRARVRPPVASASPA